MTYKEQLIHQLANMAVIIEDPELWTIEELLEVTEEEKNRTVRKPNRQ